MMIQADTEDMDISAVFAVIKQVLADKRVIGTAVFVFLMMDFGVFVAHYTKKPPKPKHKRIPTPAPAPAASGENAGEASGGTESSSGGNAEKTPAAAPSKPAAKVPAKPAAKK